MTDQELLNYLYEWVNLILNIERFIDIKIIFGEQNAPRPDIPYIVIHQPLNTGKKGRGSYKDTNDDGDLKIVNNYVASVSIEVVGGYTEYLRYLIDSIEFAYIKDFWKNRNMSFLRNEDITPIPNMTENQWELRNNVDIFVAYPTETVERTHYIETVETVNNIL